MESVRGPPEKMRGVVGKLDKIQKIIMIGGQEVGRTGWPGKLAPKKAPYQCSHPSKGLCNGRHGSPPEEYDGDDGWRAAH